MLLLFLMTLGVKEIDIAATLEHIRDQRPGLVRTKVHTVHCLCAYFFQYIFSSLQIVHHYPNASLPCFS